MAVRRYLSRQALVRHPYEAVFKIREQAGPQPGICMRYGARTSRLSSRATLLVRHRPAGSAASALLQPMMREYRPMAAPFVERGLADPTDHVLFRGCHGVLDRTADGVDPQNAQPALHCDRGRDAADAVWRAVSGCGAQGQRPGAGLCRESAL